MFCDIISYMKHRQPESDSEILDFIFLTIVHTEETEHRNNKTLSVNCFTYTHGCAVWHI